MKYKAILKIEAEFKCNNKKELKIKMWEALSKPFEDCIFGNKKDEELKFITLKDSKGKIINLKR